MSHADERTDGRTEGRLTIAIPRYAHTALHSSSSRRSSSSSNNNNNNTFDLQSAVVSRNAEALPIGYTRYINVARNDVFSCRLKPVKVKLSHSFVSEGKLFYKAGKIADSSCFLVITRSSATT